MFTSKTKTVMAAAVATVTMGVTGQAMAGLIIDNADDFSNTFTHSGTVIAGRANSAECGIDQLAPTNVNEFQPAGDWNNVSLTYDAQTLVTGGTHFSSVTFSYFIADTVQTPGLNVVKIRDAVGTVVTGATVTSDGWRGGDNLFHWYTISVAQGSYDFSKVTLALEPLGSGQDMYWWSHGIGTVQLDTVVPEPATLALLGLGVLPLLRRRR